MWTRGEVDSLWEQLQQSELLRQSLRSNAALRDRAATVLAQADYDLDGLLSAEEAATAQQRSGGMGKPLAIAGCLIAILAVVAVLAAFNLGSGDPDQDRADAQPSETPAGEPDESDNATDDEGTPPEEKGTGHDPPSEAPVTPPQPPEAAVAEAEAAGPPPERPYVSGPWDAVAALDPPPAAFTSAVFAAFFLAGDVLALIALEVGFVPAAALQAKACRRDLLAQRLLGTGRTDLERRIGNLLNRFELVGAVVASILVDWHLSVPVEAATLEAAHDLKKISKNTAFSPQFCCLGKAHKL